MRSERTGQTLAEFAIALPVFLLVFFGLIDIGRAVFTANSLTNSAREAVRLATVNQDKQLIIERAVSQTQVAAPTVAVGFYQPLTDPSTDPSDGGACGTFDSDGHVVSAPSVGCVVEVSASYDFTLLTPVVSQLIGPLALRGESIGSVEFSCPDPERPGFPFPTASSCPRQP